MRAMLAAVALIVATVASAVPALAADHPDNQALFDPASGRWHLRFGDGTVTEFFYGVPGDVPLLGDWDCDGVDTVAMYRPSNGFVYLRNDNSQGVADQEFFYGLAGDVPLAGDWDGDGCDTFAVYRNGEVFLRNRLGTGVADSSYFFGDPGDRPFAGDFDGDGTDTVGLYRDRTGFVYFRNRHSSGFADLDFFYGEPGDRIVAGDWDGDGDDSVGIFRPAAARFYLSDSNRQGFADREIAFGRGDWIPVVGRLGAGEGLPDLALETVVTGLDRPVALTAPAGDGRLFIAELGGRVLVVEEGTVTPFLDISAEVSQGGERGLLGLAFHPDYLTDGRFYLSYTDAGGDSRLDAYQVSTDPLMARPDSRRSLLTVDQPASNHNGGHIAFGPDGALYLGLGDGGGAGDPFGHGQNPTTLLGSIVRVDVEAATSAVWAFGLRNPWRFDFDRDLLYVADVGQDAVEEITVASSSAPGQNFGWARLEGSQCFRDAGCDAAGTVLPAVEYGHIPGTCSSVTGGYVYRGRAIPALDGAYLYADFCRGFLRAFRYRDGAVVASRDYTTELGDLGSVVSFGEDGLGELYVLTIDGRVRKVIAG